ncbi:formylmethanofuran dehydrogenase subunit B [Methylomarinovum caldicuralii]|uniref:Formylmethanofuran dehydrogenase subunit B n=1 Tax=Methylomarinovum caldicuralii TaxID=438856 RepID=A0AAU9C1V3_9GAMM|nr:formylmethanofuran dehydrogenase subunit B [Methylomarinovum caldicuralii]BCX82337.1 formylmethanofuran dehydrogenase subunit B [Methylomarinovum caldicuralii]
MAKRIEPGLWTEVPSPFCGIAADDLTLRVGDDGRVEVVENGDAVTRAGFEQPLGDTRPRVRGKPVDLETAVAEAAGILGRAEAPLFAGMAADVNGVRAALSLADRLGAVVDTVNAEASLRNLLVLQDSGWMTCTLAEVKNRADLIVVVGCDIDAAFPRFFERHVWQDGMFVAAGERQVTFLGRAPSGTSATAPDGTPPRVLACEDSDLPQVVAALRALAKDAPVTAESVGGINVAELRNLAEALKAARYGVVVWAAGALAWDHAELTVQNLCELVKEINRTTRCSGLPLGGKNGDQTVTQVCGWQTGFPLRVDFRRGAPNYDPWLNAAGRLLAGGEADALLWLAAFDATQTPPAADIPQVVVGRCGMTLDREPEVFIPVGCPGIDHAGHTYRTDNVVAVRLYRLRETELPSAAEVLQAIEARLR